MGLPGLSVDGSSDNVRRQVVSHLTTPREPIRAGLVEGADGHADYSLHAYQRQLLLELSRALDAPQLNRW